MAYSFQAPTLFTGIYFSVVQILDSTVIFEWDSIIKPSPSLTSISCQAVAQKKYLSLFRVFIWEVSAAVLVNTVVRQMGVHVGERAVEEKYTIG